MSGLRTGGLRRRVVATAVGLAAASMLVVAAALTLTLGDRVRAGVAAELEDRAALAATLDGTVPRAELLRRVSGDGVVARVEDPPEPGAPGNRVEAVVDGVVVVGSTGVLPSAPTPAGASVAVPVPDQAGAARADREEVVVPLSDGSLLRLSASTSLAEVATGEALRTLALAGVAVLVLGALAMTLVVRVTLRPLDRMTGLANAIAAGGRGERLAPDRTDTELGRAAAAFDAMLDALEHALADARAAEERMRRFCSDASHELRTPMATVTATAETLLRGSADRERVEELSCALVRESRRADRIIDDLMLAARLDASDAAGVLRVERVDVAALVADAVARTRLVDGAAVSLSAPAGGVTADADPARVTQIVVNLLDNAVRWTPPGGGVRVTVSGDAGRVLVQVDDDGPGVPDGERERIFGRLVRLQDHRDRASGGSGLGLAISRELARAHGGDLTCPRPGPGGCFVLSLPAAAA